MNYKQFGKLNELKCLLEHTSLSGSKSNMLSINLNESYEHLITKFKVMLLLVAKGHSVFSEVKFRNNLGRADLVSFDEKGKGYIWEIVKSEKEESINNKLNKYPIDFEVFIIKVGETINLPI